MSLTGSKETNEWRMLIRPLDSYHKSLACHSLSSRVLFKREGIMLASFIQRCSCAFYSSEVGKKISWKSRTWSRISFLKPFWTYGIQIWRCTKQSNIDIIQRFQNKVLRHMVNAPWYIRNNYLHKDLQVDVVSSKIQRFAQKHEDSTIMRTMRPYSSWTTRA